MSHTNNTTHYSFPQFVANDTPAWLTDVNQAFSSIDAEIYARQQTIASNTDAITGHTAQINTINDKLTADELDIANLTGRVATAESNIANNTTVLSQHTADISALANQLTNLDASQIAYDNTTSLLTSNDVQGAVDELNTKVDTILNGYLQLVEYTKIVNLSANTYHHFLVQSEIEAQIPQGYAFIGWVQSNSGLARVTPSIQTSTDYWFYNPGSAANSVTLKATALFVKE